MSDFLGFRGYDPIFIGNDVRLGAGKASVPGDILIPGGPAPIFALNWDNGTTAADGTTPTTATRASNAYRTDWDGSKHTLTLVGNDVIRVGSYNDGTVTRNAVQIEGAATNLLTYSEDFSNAAWTDLDAGDALGTGIATPDTSKTSAALVPDSTDGAHGFTQAVTTTNAAHTLSVYAKAGAEDWLYLSNDTVSNADAYFDLAAGAVGTEGAAGTGYIEDIGDGWYRCILSFTATAASNTMRIAAATADGDATFAGDGTAISTHLWGAQLETGPYATSQIVTTSSSATRAADSLEYSGLSVLASGSPFTISAYALREGVDSLGGVVSLSDGGLTNERVLLRYNGVGNAIGQVIATNNTQANLDAANAFTAGAWQHLQLAADTDSFEFFIDGTVEATDTSGALPTGLDQVNIGAYQSGSNIRNGFIGPIRIYDKVVTP